MRFLADMGVDRRVVRWLSDLGNDAIHLSEQGLHTLPDPAVFDKAHTENWILLTFDLDFGEILALSRRGAVSVELFRLHNTRTPHVIERLGAALDFSQELERGAIVVVEESRCRVRKLPIGRTDG